MRVLVGVYVLTACVFATEGNWAKMLYWIGATIITCSVLVMS